MLKPMFVLLVVLGLVAALAVPVRDSFAVVYEVGVGVGQWAEYSVLGGWDVSPSDANVPMPQAIVDARNTEFINMSVESASVRTVTLSRTTKFKNGSRTVALISGDVETGGGTLNLTVVSRSLEVGDRVANDPESNVRVAFTERRTYAGAERLVNYANHTESIVSGSRLFEFRWDKLTGMMVAMMFLQEDTTTEYAAISSILVTMQRTNIWESGGSNPLEFFFRYAPGILLVGVFAAAAVLTYFAVFRKPKRSRRGRYVKTRGNHASAGLRIIGFAGSF